MDDLRNSSRKGEEKRYKKNQGVSITIFLLSFHSCKSDYTRTRTRLMRNTQVELSVLLYIHGEKRRHTHTHKEKRESQATSIDQKRNEGYYVRSFLFFFISMEMK